MSRRRTARVEDVVHAYWPHSDPEPAAHELGARPADHGDEPCPGLCNADFRRAETETTSTGLTHNVPFHPGRPVWCVDVHAFNDRGELLHRLEHRGCTTRILNQLGEIPDLAAALIPGRLTTPRDADIDHSSSKGGGARSLSHAPSPSPGWDTADELIRWAVDLEDWLRARLQAPAAPSHVPAVLRVRRHTVPCGHLGPVGPSVGYRGTMAAPTERTLAAAVAYLRRNGTALLAGPGALQTGQDISDTHRRLQRLVGHDRLTHRLQEPCPACGRKGLRRRDGDELVKCVACHAVWDWDHFQLLARAYADTITRTGGRA